jgi:hypothetical protein
MEERVKTGYYKGEFLPSMDSTVRKFHPVLRIFGEEETDFFDTVLQIPTCVDLGFLSEQAKAQVSYTILQRIYRQFGKLGHSKLRLLTILDEAQLILAVRQAPGLMPQKPLQVYLGNQGVDHQTIRKLARCELKRVTDVLRLAGISKHTGQQSKT